MRMFNREFADEFLKYSESNRFIDGIFINISKKWTTVEICQRERFAGISKFNYKRKMQLAFDAVLDFSEFPLLMTVKFGTALIVIGIIGLFILLVLKLFFINFQAGWPSIIASIVNVFGLQLFFIDIISLYIGRIYKEVKRRPLYSLKAKINL